MMCIILMQTTACSTVLKQSGTLERHAIIVDKTGKPYLPIEPSTCTTTGEFDTCNDSRHWTTKIEETYLTNAYNEYVHRLILAAKEHFTKKNMLRKKLLVFIHGGLNQQGNSNERVSTLANRIKEETQDEYYPIFVNWNSALFSSYGEHLTSVRQGSTDSWAWATSPTYLATDLGRGLIRAPVVWWSLIRNDLTSWPSEKNNWLFNFLDLAKEERNANMIAKTLQDNPSAESFSFWFGPQAPSTFWKDRMWDSTTTALTYPIKFLSSPWIDALGKSAWENMLRRTDLLFHTEQDFQAKSAPFTPSYQEKLPTPHTACESLFHQEPGLVHKKPGGAISIFFRMLAEEIHMNSDWSITLVGHSMGAIIVNHILRDFGPCLPIDNIIFMAAASTINSYNDSVFPYMAWRIQEKKTDERKSEPPKIYHLMLHELAETSETNYWNLPPTGSLLVWIDNFLSTPNTPMDRTSGRFTNLMLSLHTTPEEIRPHISIKRFPGGGSSWGGTREGIPANHSDFSGRFRFWEKTCWEIPQGNNESEQFHNERNKGCFY